MKVNLLYINILLLIFALSVEASSSSASNSSSSSSAGAHAATVSLQAKLKTDPKAEYDLLMSQKKQRENELIEKRKQLDALSKQLNALKSEEMALESQLRVADYKLLQNSHYQTLHATEMFRQKKAAQASKLILEVPYHIVSAEKPIKVTVKQQIPGESSKYHSIDLYPSDNVLTIFRQVLQKTGYEVSKIKLYLGRKLLIEGQSKKNMCDLLKELEGSTIIAQTSGREYPNEELLNMYETQMGIDR